MKVNKFLPALLACMLLFSIAGLAQSAKLPPFRVLQSNGKVFRAEDLPMGKPIVIIYFSPECDHCQALMKDFFKSSAGFKKASIAMITFLTVDKVTKFERDYHLNKYSNIYAGTEGTSYFLKNYYKIQDLPFVALYNKNGELQKLYTASDKGALKDVIERLNKLK